MGGRGPLRGGWLGRVVEEIKEGKLIQIQNETFERMKGNSV